jgi:ABC-type polysaccharide/polyol phosphate transport system ATPase subunit
MNELRLTDVVFSRVLERTSRSKRTERRVIDGVTIDFASGERVGLLGTNGAGKTTLLRLIAGIFTPDSGSVQRDSNVSVLLDAGHGLVDSLSARENCVSRFTVNGVPRSSIPGLVKWVEQFSELGDYFDQPLRSLSSGMFTRIVFALATAQPHEVVLIDEGFGLADEYFRRKAQAVLDEIYSNASIVIFASHDAELLKTVCTRGIILSGGKIYFDGSINDAVATYRASLT